MAAALFITCLAAFGVYVARHPGANLEPGSLERDKASCYPTSELGPHVAFVGSSQTYRQVVPAIVEAELVKSGRNLAVVNLGLPGMSLVETSFTVRRLLKHRPPGLEVVVVELRDLGLRRDPRQLTSLRHASWHGLRETAQSAVMEWRLGRADGIDRLRFAMAHVHSGALALSGAGAGVAAVAGSFPQDCDRFSATLGYRSLEADLDGADPTIRLRRERFALRTEPPTGVTSTEAGTTPEEVLQLLRRLVAQCRSEGVEPLFYVAGPVWTRFSVWDGLAAAGLQTIERFDDPAWARRQWQAGLLFDESHLTQAGAREYSERLGAAVARHLAGDRS